MMGSRVPLNQNWQYVLTVGSSRLIMPKILTVGPNLWKNKENYLDIFGYFFLMNYDYEFFLLPDQSIEEKPKQ